MEQLKDTVSYLVRLSGSEGVGRTVLVKLVYFAELESWTSVGRPLTGTTFYRHHYGAWAPDVRWVAEHSPQIEHRTFLGIHLEHRYRLRPTARMEALADDTRALLERVFAEYGRLTAARAGQLSKETLPMLASREGGSALDLTLVAPRRPAVRVTSAALAEAQATADRSTRGTRAELDEQALAEYEAWKPARARAAQA